MKHRKWTTSLVLLTLLASLGWFGSAALNTPAAANGEEASPDGKTTLHDLMEDLGGEFRTLRRSVRKEDEQAKALATTSKMQNIVLTAKDMAPNLKDIEEAEHEAYAKDYRMRMIELMHALLDCEKALLEGRSTDAYEHVKTMAVIQKEGHEKFRIP